MVRASKPYEERWSTDQVQECGELWSLTKDEHHKLLELQAKISDIDHWKNDPFEVVRFLKEFRFDVKTTETKFRTSIQWRLENNADFILEEYTPPALYSYFPLGVMEGADRDGQPIYIERSGAADAYGLLQRFGRDEMIQQAIWSKELLSRGPWQEKWPTRITAFLTILDLKGLNRHHLNPHLIPVGQAVTRLTQDNYPGFGKKILVIRAPFIFRFVWNVFKHFVDPHVKELIEIATENETEELLEKYMDLSVLPKEIAPGKGQGRAVQGYEPVWEGGHLPPPGNDDWKRGTPVFRRNHNGNKFPEPELDANLLDTSQPHSIWIAPSTPPNQSCANADAVTEHVEVTLEKVPHTPIQPKTSDSSTCASASSTSDWEKLPTPAPRKKNIQQAWTVTPEPCYNLDEVWNKTRVDDMAQLWQLNEMEKQHMDDFKDRIQDIQHWKNDPYELVRFYREFKGDLEKAEHSFRRMIVFRVENHMDKYVQQYGEPNPLFHYVPCTILRGKDKDGDPIFLDRLGSCDWHSLLKHFGHDGVTNYLTFIRELNNCRQFWEPYEKHVLGGRRVRRYTVILDLEGLHPWHARPSLLALLKRTSRISHYYSGWVKRILIVRAPHAFRLIWPMVKGYFAYHVRDLIEFSGRHCYLSLLDKYVDRTVLPSVICPEGKGASIPGYYQNIMLEGGPIPKEVINKALATTKPGSSPWTPENNSGIQPSSRRLLAPMPPGSDDYLDPPSSPVSTRHLMMGTWGDDVDASVELKEKISKEECQGGFESPMFTYYW